MPRDLPRPSYSRDFEWWVVWPDGYGFVIHAPSVATARVRARQWMNRQRLPKGVTVTQVTQ